MKSRSVYLIIPLLLAPNMYASTVNVALGTANLFAVLGGTAVSNSGLSIINGNLGLWSGTSITGFTPGSVNGMINATDATAMQAQMDLTSAYNVAAGQPCGGVLTGQNLGGQTLTAGVYCFASSAQLTGTLTLDAEGNSNAVFIFQIGGTLTTASSSQVTVINGGTGSSVFWQVGNSATLGTESQFAGSILALSNITLGTGADISCGRALALNGAVTLDTNLVSMASLGCSAGPIGVPEPGTASLVSMSLILGLLGCLCSRRAAPYLLK
ncbi:MAG: ice-binding family protein [Acidobacteriota bacterium]